MMSKRKELWRAIKLYLLYNVIEFVIIGFVAIPIVFHDLSMHMSRETVEEHMLQSDYYKLSECIAYLLIIALFINKRYVKMSLGRMARMKRTTLWTAIGIAAMISVGCCFFSISFWELIGGRDNLFPKDIEKIEKMYGPMSEGILSCLAGAILIPICEEILFRGIMLRSMLKMRWHPWIAILISALIFSAMHGTTFQTIDILPFGIIVGWLYWRTKSLLPGIVIHIVNNSIAFVLPQFVESNDDDIEVGMKVWIVTFGISIALMAYGIYWYRKKAQCLESSLKKANFASVNAIWSTGTGTNDKLINSQTHKLTNS